MTWPPQNPSHQPQHQPPAPRPGYSRPPSLIARNTARAALLWSYVAAGGAVLLLVGGGSLLAFERGHLPSVNRVAPTALGIRLTNDEQVHFKEQAVYVTPTSAAATATCEEFGVYASARPQPIHRATPDRPELATREVDGATYGFVGRASSFAAEIRCSGPGVRGLLLTHSDRDHLARQAGIAALVAAPFLAVAGVMVNRVSRPRRRKG